MKVIIDCFDALPTGATDHDLRIVIMDAMAEYVSARANGNGEAYVNKRYPDENVYSGEARKVKIASVNLRCRVARMLHGFADIRTS